MKIVHINNIANVAWRLARAQVRLGHEAFVCSLYDTAFHFPSDMSIRGAEGPIGFNKEMFARRRFFSRFDVVHVHGGIWKAQLFYPWLKVRFPKITLAVHYHGSEVRSKRGLYHQRWVDAKFHSTPDLQRWLPDSTWIPNPIDIPDIPPNADNRVPRFGHFPSSGLAKGTEAVVSLFRKVFGRGPTTVEGHVTRYTGTGAELWVVSGAPHTEALRMMQTCDAVIDQIAPYGAYGTVAVEAMAYGKPVFSTVNRSWYPECPIVQVRDGVEPELLAVAHDASLRKRLGIAGREYVARLHDSRRVADMVLKSYRAKPAAP